MMMALAYVIPGILVALATVDLYEHDYMNHFEICMQSIVCCLFWPLVLIAVYLDARFYIKEGQERRKIG